MFVTWPMNIDCPTLFILSIIYISCIWCTHMAGRLPSHQTSWSPAGCWSCLWWYRTCHIWWLQFSWKIFQIHWTLMNKWNHSRFQLPGEKVRDEFQNSKCSVTWLHLFLQVPLPPKEVTDKSNWTLYPLWFSKRIITDLSNQTWRNQSHMYTQAPHMKNA